MPFAPDTLIYILPGFLMRYTDTAWSVASTTFQECPLPARTDNMRVYSACLPVAAPMAGPLHWQSDGGRRGANVQAARHDSSHLEGQPAALTGGKGDHRSNPVRVSSNRIAASP